MEDQQAPHIATPPHNPEPPPPANPLIQQARDLVHKYFPEADAAFLGGSAAAGTATPTSDLDIAVLRPTGHETFRNTTRETGRIVEWFAHTPDTVDRFLDDSDRRAVMASIYGHGIVLINKNGAADNVAARAQAILAAGPSPRDPQELEALRYSLTDVYDDLTDAKNDHEQLAIASCVAEIATTLLCELRGAWTARGKWLPRRAHEADPTLGLRLTDAWLTLARTANPTPLLEVTRALLDEAGGPLHEGFRRTAPPPDAAP
jgi:predicted nucleotidyltransferase